MKIWPAIDLRDGKAVRLQQGDYKRETIFGESPAIVAQRWEQEGAHRLHLVDLDAARGQPSEATMAAVLEILQSVRIPCQLGGGIRDDAAIDRWLDAGVHRLVVGSAALKQPDWFARRADERPGRLVAGIDARDGMVATDGWLETSSTPATQLAQQLRSKTNQGSIAAIVYTDIAKDGMMSGPNLEGLREMATATDIPLVASGGVTTLEDIQNVREIEIPECIIGRTLYEGHIQLADALNVANDQAPTESEA
ncbi:MAG: 1-(5-phosphoribosyl)-5-[(5-phosphoribosylamino)methylideneamino]imidazole-4-carboxamide isomerase [Planctomycetota bacterium]